MISNPLIKQQFVEASELLDSVINNEELLANIQKAADYISECFSNGGKLMTCGNGGSHCDAMHFAEELTGRFRENRRPLPAIAISDPSHISCVSNDFGYNQVFARYIEALGKSEDILCCFSTSGNSANVLEAVNVANRLGMRTIAFTGNDGGAVAPLVNLEIRVPHFGFADRIQEIHIKIIHTIILVIEKTIR